MVASNWYCAPVAILWYKAARQEEYTEISAEKGDSDDSES